MEQTTQTPAPQTTEAPAPQTTEAPAPQTTEAPAPQTTEAPAPQTTEAPAPQTTEASAPQTTEAPTPQTTEAPTPQTTEAPAPQTTEAPRNRKLGISTEGIEGNARNELGRARAQADQIATSERTTHRIVGGAEAAAAMAGGYGVYRACRKAQTAKKFIAQSRAEALSKLSQSLSKTHPDIWSGYKADAETIKKVNDELRQAREDLKKASKADRAALKNKIKELTKDINAKQEALLGRLRADKNIEALVSSYTDDVAKGLEAFEKGMAGATDDVARVASAREFAKSMPESAEVKAANGKRLDAQKANLEKLEADLKKTNQAAAKRVKALRDGLEKSGKLLSVEDIEKAVNNKAFKMPEGVSKAFASAETAAEKAFLEDITKVAGKAKIGGVARNFKILDEVIVSEGKTGAAKILGSSVEEASAAIAGGAAESQKLVAAAEKAAQRSALAKSSLGRWVRNGKLVGGAAGVLAVAGIVATVNQGTYNKEKDEAIQQLAEKLNSDGNIRELSNTYSADKRAELINWALENTDDPAEKELLEKVKANGYDYARVLVAEKKLDLVQSEGALVQGWADGINEIVQTNANVNFYKHLSDIQKKENERNSQENTPEDNGTAIPVEDPNNNDDDNDNGDDDDNNNGNEDEELTPNQKRIKELEEKENRTPEEEKELKDRKRDEEIIAFQKRIDNGETLSDEDQARFKTLKEDQAKNPVDKKSPEETKITGREITPPTQPSRRRGGTTTDPKSPTSTTSTTSTPEAIVQPPEEEGWFSRNWKWMVMLFAIAVTGGLAYLLIRRQQKKAAQAKKEKEALSSQVTDLQKQLEDATATANSNEPTPTVTVATDTSSNEPTPTVTATTDVAEATASTLYTSATNITDTDLTGSVTTTSNDNSLTA